MKNKMQNLITCNMQQPNKNKKKTSWELQQAKVKAEKEAKLKKLLEQERPVYKKKTIDEKIVEKRAQENTKTVQKDNTTTKKHNDASKHSTSARNKTDKEIAEEVQARIDAQAKANGQPFDWSNFRQSLADRSQATEDALRVSNEPNFFDDYLNPAAMIGSMADNLGQAPLRAQQENSYMPYFTSIGTPLAVGALGGLGTNGSTKQFVNNLANPLAGFGLKDKASDVIRIGKEIIQNPKAVIGETIKEIKKLPNQTEQVYHTFMDRNKPLYKIGADNLENALESKIKNLQTEEGFNRLVNQELEITRNINPYHKEKDLLEKANKNANARIDELAQTENLNKSFLNAKLENPNINVNPFLDFGIPKNNAHFRGDYNNAINLDFLKKVNKDFVLDGGAVKPGKIAIGREYAEDIGVFDHEINHALQNGRQTKIDKDIIEHFSNLENRKAGLVSKKRSSDADEAALSYLLTGSKGKEPSSFLAEARQAMLNKNLIKDIYEPITPEIVEKSMNYFSKNPIKNKYTKSSSTRIFDIANKNSAEFLANQMNKLPAIAPIGLGASYLGAQENNQKTSQFAMGGNLKQQTNNNMLNEFNVGNTHENNPLGGIPQGMGNNGQMNTVEQGETKKDSFIYSNRITLTPQVIAQFNLPKSLAGKTAADATKLINNKFEGRNSKIDNNTKKAFLDRIAEAQETVKAEEQAKIAEAMQINSTEVPDMMEGQIPQGMEEFTQPMAYGGNLQNKMNFGGFFQGQQGQNNMGMIGNMAGSMGNSMNTYGQQMNQSKLPEGYVDEKAMQDAQGNQMIDSTKDTIASATGPIGQMFRGIQKAGQGIGNSIGGEGGAAVSGIFSPEEGTMSAMKDKDLSIGQKALATIPGVGGVIAKRQADKRLNKWKFEKDTFEANSKISNFALGGNLGDPVKSTQFDPTKEDFLPVRKIVPITSSDGSKQYQYFYGKLPNEEGYDVDMNSHIYNSDEHTAKQNKKHPEYSERANNYLNKTKGLLSRDITKFSKGGNMYGGGGNFDKSSASYDPTKISLNLPGQSNQILDNLNYVKNLNNQGLITLSDKELTDPVSTYSNPELAPENKYVSPYPKAKLGETLNKAGKYAKDNYGNALRYAPVAMNAYQLAKMGKPEVETLDRLGNKYNPQYMDEKALTNQINAETNYTANALANASNGSLGSLSNNILGMQLNKSKALSDAYSKIANVNRNEDKTAQQFNLGVDQANIGQSNLEKDINAANRAAYRREKSKLLGNIGEDLGNIGKEQVYKKLAGKAFGYSYDGEYLLKPDGTKVSEKELDSTIKTNLSSVGATEKDGKYFDTTGKEISKEEVLKMIGTQKTFNKNYQGKFSSMNTDFGNISLTNNNKQ